MLISGQEILARIAEHYPIEPAESNSASLASLYRIGDFRGRIGIIEGRSRKFCNSCNRVLVSANGKLRSCIYSPASLDLHQMIKSGNSAETICRAIAKAVSWRYRDGIAAEAAQTANSPLTMTASGS